MRAHHLDLAIATLFAARSLLFVGHSLTDPDLRSVLDEWQEVFGQGGAPRHFFLGAGLTGLAERRLLDRGVMPMSYGAAGDHALLGPVLEHLATPPGAAMISASTAPARATRERGAT